MKDENRIQLFEDKRIRTAWDEENEEWLFSVVDVVGVLTDQPTPRSASNYWAKLKERLSEEGANQLLTNCQQLKLKAADGKGFRKIDRWQDVAVKLRAMLEERLKPTRVNLSSHPKTLLISASLSQT